MSQGSFGNPPFANDVCLHSDFRIGGLKPGETKKIHGKIYLVDANIDALLKRYRRDFPERA